jgi:hypothetical protein
MRASGLGKAFIKTPEVTQILSIPLPRGCVIRAQLDRAPEFRLRAPRIPLIEEPDPCTRIMSLGAGSIQLHGLAGVGLRFQEGVFQRNRFHRSATEDDVSVGSARVSFRISRLFIDCLREVSNCLL